MVFNGLRSICGCLDFRKTLMSINITAGLINKKLVCVTIECNDTNTSFLKNNDNVRLCC